MLYLLSVWSIKRSPLYSSISWTFSCTCRKRRSLYHFRKQKQLNILQVFGWINILKGKHSAVPGVFPYRLKSCAYLNYWTLSGLCLSLKGTSATMYMGAYLFKYLINLLNLLRRQDCTRTSIGNLSNLNVRSKVGSSAACAGISRTLEQMIAWHIFAAAGTFFLHPHDLSPAAARNLHRPRLEIPIEILKPGSYQTSILITPEARPDSSIQTALKRFNCDTPLCNGFDCPLGFAVSVRLITCLYPSSLPRVSYFWLVHPPLHMQLLWRVTSTVPPLSRLLFTRQHYRWINSHWLSRVYFESWSLCICRTGVSVPLPPMDVCCRLHAPRLVIELEARLEFSMPMQPS